MGSALAGTGVKIMAPETMNWYGFPGYFAGIQNNSGAWGYTNVWTKRFLIMGSFSRFARPGTMRDSTSGTAPSGVLLSACVSPADGTVVVVAINSNSSATPLSLSISGVAPCSITPRVTSATDSIASKSPITVSNARFSATIDAQSVTTVVGKP